MKQMHLWMSAALALALTLPMAAQADNQNVQAQQVAEGGRQVKMFVFDEINTPNCTVKQGSTLKYYNDGAMAFNGDVMCKQAMKGNEFEMRFKMLSDNGEKIFDKGFEQHDFNQNVNQWMPMSAAFHSSHFRSNHWDNIREATFIKTNDRS